MVADQSRRGAAQRTSHASTPAGVVVWPGCDRASWYPSQRGAAGHSSRAGRNLGSHSVMPLLAAGTALVAWAGAKPEFDLRQTVLAQVQAVGARSDKPTLNVGCPGERWLTYDDVSFDACLDADPGRLQFCHARRPTLGDIRQLPFASGEFGACLCSHVLEHLPSIADVQRAVRELERTSDRV